MAATKEDIREWFKRGLEQGATHMIIMCDTFDWDDYPVYIMPGQDVRRDVAYRSNQNMQRVMEVYNLAMSMDEQMAQHRCFNY